MRVLLYAVVPVVTSTLVADLVEQLARGDSTIRHRLSFSQVDTSISSVSDAFFRNRSKSSTQWYAICSGARCPRLPGQDASMPPAALQSQKLFFPMSGSEYTNNHMRTCLTADIFDSIPRIFKAEAFVEAASSAGDTPSASAFILIDEFLRQRFGFNRKSKQRGHPLAGKWLSMGTERAGDCLFSLLSAEGILGLVIGLNAAIAPYLGGIFIQGGT